MASDNTKTIYTIGVGRKEFGDFVAELKAAGVRSVVDIRSYNNPKKRPEFASGRLRQALEREGISYEWQGEVLGDHPKDRSLYVDGSRENPVDYGLQEQSETYRAALDAISERLMEGEVLCVLGSEADPAYSHRTLGFGQAFERRTGMAVSHITGVGTQASQADVVTRTVGGERMMAAAGVSPDDYLNMTFLSDSSMRAAGSSVVMMQAKDLDRERRTLKEDWSYGIPVEVVQSSSGSFLDTAKENAEWGDITLAVSPSFSSRAVLASKETAGGRFIAEELPMHSEDLRDPDVAMAAAIRAAMRVKMAVSKGGYDLSGHAKSNSYDRDVAVWTGDSGSLQKRDFDRGWAVLGVELANEGWNTPVVKIVGGTADAPEVQTFRAGQEEAFRQALSAAVAALPKMAQESDADLGVLLFDDNFSAKWRQRLERDLPSFAQPVFDVLDPLKAEVSDVVIEKPLRLNVVASPMVGATASSLEDVDLETYARNVLGYLIDEGVGVSGVRTSGQAGMEAAFTSAAQYWMCDPTVLCPQGFRLTIDDGMGVGMNVSDEAMFMNRFRGGRREMVENLPARLAERIERMQGERMRGLSASVSREERPQKGLSDAQILTLRLCGLSNASLSEVIRAAHGRTFSGASELKVLLDECRENGVEGIQYIAEPMIENMIATAARHISEGEQAGVHLLTVESERFPVSLSDIPAPSSFKERKRDQAKEAVSELEAMYELYGFSATEMAEIGEEWRRRSGGGEETGMDLDDGAPVLLWYRGDLSALDTLSVALVGSTTPLPETELAARRFSERTALSGASVVVSWNPGTSLSAMETAMANDGKVIAVMSGGLDDKTVHMTPGLASRVVASGGLLLSEWPVGVHPDTYRTELRERLVAALGDGTVVISGSKDGRSAGIARKAYEMNRTVFAVEYTDAVTREIREKLTGNEELVRQGARTLPSTAGMEYDEAIMMMSGASEGDIRDIRIRRAAEKASTLVIAPDPKRAVRYSVLHLPGEDEIYLVPSSDAVARKAVVEHVGHEVRFEEPKEAATLKEDYIRRAAVEFGSGTARQYPQPWTDCLYYRDGKMQDMLEVFSKGMPPKNVRLENKVYFDMLRQAAELIQESLQEAAGLPRTPAYRFAEAMYLTVAPNSISVMQGDRVRGSVSLSPIGTIKIDYNGDGPVYKDGPGLERLGYYEQEKPVFRTRLAGMNVSAVRNLAADMVNSVMGFGDDEERYIFSSKAFADDRHRSTQLDKNDEVERMENVDNVAVAASDVAKAVSEGSIFAEDSAKGIDEIMNGLNGDLQGCIHKVSLKDKSKSRSESGTYKGPDSHILVQRCGKACIMQFSKRDTRMAYGNEVKSGKEKGTKLEPFSKWYDRCYVPTEKHGRVMKNGKMNLLSRNGEEEMLYFDKLHRPLKNADRSSTEKWPDYVGELKDGIALVTHGGKSNFVNEKGELLCSKWYDRTREYCEGYAAVCTVKTLEDGRTQEYWNFVNREGKELFVNEFSYVGDFHEGWAVIRTREDEKQPLKYNFVSTDKHYLTRQWYDRAEDFREGFAVIEKDGMANFIGADGKELFKNWCSETRGFHEGWAVIRTREDENPSLKYNYVNRKNQLLSKVWFDSALDFNEGKGHAVCNGVEYDVDRIGWRLPQQEMENSIKNGKEEAESIGQEIEI